MTDEGRTREVGPPPAVAPHPVRVPVNIHHWDDISFLHWPFPPDVVADLVPERLTVLTHGGTAWVGVTPFHIRVRPGGMPLVLPGWAFPETNLRTYVAGPDGREGVWFFRMEVTALWFVATLRALGLPYVRSRMSIDRDPGTLTYRSEPPGDSPGGHHIAVRRGEALEPDPLDTFLTARWNAYHSPGPLLLSTPVEHGRWPLFRGVVERCEVDGLFAAARLPGPEGDPLVHVSPGVEVRVGAPRIVSANRSR